MDIQATLAIAVNELRAANSAANSLNAWEDITQVSEQALMRDLRHATRHARNAADKLHELTQLIKEREL